ncbi:peroxide stress protein YaaA [Brachybacterium sp. DNPG3]
MLILLPPSETKTRPDAAERFAIESLAEPALRADRATMLRAAIRTARSAGAAEQLGVPASSPELVGRMAALEEEPAGAALSVYSGVLYDQLDAHRPIPADRRVLVQSALLGVVDAAVDRIPAYRLSAASRVSRLGAAGSWWGPRLTTHAARLLAEQADSSSPVVIDCRSGSYRSMMRLRGNDAVRVLEVAPVQEKGGRRTVISHDAKRYRGIVTDLLLAAASAPADADETVDLLREGFARQTGRGTGAGAGFGVELDGDRLIVIDRVG